MPLLFYEGDQNSGKERAQDLSEDDQPPESEETPKPSRDNAAEIFDFHARPYHQSWQISVTTILSYILDCISTISSSFKFRKSTESGGTTISIAPPSFTTTWFWSSKEGANRKKIHPTSWLDGLRGVAALFVVFYHSIWLWTPSVLRGWGSGPGDENRWIVQLPFIRIFFSGQAMVAVFFVVSGFSLSYKPLKLIRVEQFSKLLETLASSVFRRMIRLWLPIAIFTFFEMLAVFWGFYDAAPPGRRAAKEPTLTAQIHHWFFTTVSEADPFRPTILHQRHSSPYDPNLWTIPIEYRGSMVVFLTILMLSKSRLATRLIISASTSLFCLYRGYWDLFLFLSGMVLADWHHMRSENGGKPPSEHEIFLPSTPRNTSSRKRSSSVYMNAFWFFNFASMVWILSIPDVADGADASMGFVTLVSWVPDQYRSPAYVDMFWRSVAAVWLVLCVEHGGFLQSIFTTDFARYLGKISFSLYIVHGPVLYTFGISLVPGIIKLTGEETGFQITAAWVLVAVGILPVMFAMAHVTSKAIDENCVVFARWVSEKLM